MAASSRSRFSSSSLAATPPISSTAPPQAWILSLAALSLLLVPWLVGCGPAETVGSEEQHSTEGPPLAFEDYQVLFTNPVCEPYPYGADQQVESVAGEPLSAKPKDVFCTSDDAAASGARPESPEHKIIEWIQDPATEHVFFTALSFSNSRVLDALCAAVTERSVKVDFVLDRDTSLSKADKLLACAPASGDPADMPELHLRGKEGNISLHHNKLFLFNPDAERVRIAFGSGNVSSGLVLHHENWHFVTVPAATYFVQAHLCLMQGLLEHGHAKGDYSEYVRACKESIGLPEESDAKTFFVPGEGGRATQTILNAIEDAVAIDIAAHRYTHSTHVKRLRQRLENDGISIRFVSDDDMYWVGQGEQVGGNELFEYEHVQSLAEVGMEPRYLETNHAAHLLHHNKFYLFAMPDETDSAVFCGAGNFTKTAFRDNYENFYYLRIPSVVQRFREQYEHLWQDLATMPPNLPSENVLPPQH